VICRGDKITFIMVKSCRTETHKKFQNDGHKHVNKQKRETNLPHL